MSDQELRQLVEKIVEQVMSRLAQDDELAGIFKKDKPAGQWAGTCSSYRGGEEKSPIVEPAVTKRLYTEKDILEIAKRGAKELVVVKKTIITPAARDAAAQKGVVIKLV